MLLENANDTYPKEGSPNAKREWDLTFYWHALGHLYSILYEELFNCFVDLL